MADAQGHGARPTGFAHMLLKVADIAYGAISVNLVRVRKSSEQSAMAEIEAPPSTVAADAAVAVPDQSPTATRARLSRKPQDRTA
jgi:hypothetical protein